MVFLKQIKKNRFIWEILTIIILFVLIVPVIFPYFRAGFFPTHDGEWAVVRLVEMFRSIKDLQFPVRYSGSLNYGYGYPLFNFSYPMPYYSGILFVLLKFGFVGSVKALFAGSVIAGAIGMYILSRVFFTSSIAGVVSAVFYTYMPYHLVDLYVRGSIGEAMSFGIFPFVLFCVYKIFTSDKKILYSILSGVSLGFLVPTHNIMALQFMPVLLVFMIGMYLSRKINILHLLTVYVVGFGLSAFFFIPAIFEKDNILLSIMPIADRSLYFVKPFDLLWSPFGYGTPTSPDPFTYQIGIPILISFFISLVLVGMHILRKDKETRLQSNVVGLLAILTILFVFMLFSPSALVWENIPLLSDINYPWTLLSQIGFLMSFLAGSLFIQKKIVLYIGIFLAFCMILLYLPNAKPSEYLDRGEEFYVTNLATTTSSNELMPLWVAKQPASQVEDKVIVIDSDGGVVSDIVNTSDQQMFDVVLDEPSHVRINTIYYPGWKAYTEKGEIPIDYSNEFGVMDLSLPSGYNSVELRFTETPIRMISNFISLATGLSVIIYLGYFFQKKF